MKTIDRSGHISGSKNSCDISGEISVPDENINIYQLEYTLSGATCADKSGAYSGLGIIALDENSHPYFLGLSKNSDDTRMDGVYLPLDDTPISFTVAQLDNSVSDFIGLQNGQKISEKMKAFVDLDNWPNLVPEAMANLLNPVLLVDKLIIKNDGTDATNQEINSMSDVVDYSTQKPAPVRYGSEFSLEYVDFTGSDFNGIRFKPVIDDSTNENPEIYTELRNMIFDGADMENVRFASNQPIFYSYFENTNLQGSNISDVNWAPFNYPEQDFDRQYVPYYERPFTAIDQYDYSANDFSGAWWEDCHRCGIDIGLMPTGRCTFNLLDSGLTYEEWKSGKWEAEKIVERIEAGVEDLADDGVAFLKDTGSDVVNAVASWW